MPIYVYKCDNNHYKDDLRSYSERNDELFCPSCDLAMRCVPAGPLNKSHPKENTGGEIKVRYLYGKPRNVFHFRDAFCIDCDRRTLVDCTDTEKEYSREAAECEYCNGKNLQIYIPVPSVDRFGERFPYFDRGLGMWLQSKSHRKRMCKKMGVEPIEGDIDFSSEVSALRKEQEDDKKVVDDLKDKMDNHPGFKEYRELKDKGFKPKFKHRRR